MTLSKSNYWCLVCFLVSVAQCQCWWWVCSSLPPSSCFTSGVNTHALKPQPRQLVTPHLAILTHRTRTKPQMTPSSFATRACKNVFLWKTLSALTLSFRCQLFQMQGKCSVQRSRTIQLTPGNPKWLNHFFFWWAAFFGDGFTELNLCRFFFKNTKEH